MYSLIRWSVPILLCVLMLCACSFGMRLPSPANVYSQGLQVPDKHAA